VEKQRSDSDTLEKMDLWQKWLSSGSVGCTLDWFQGNKFLEQSLLLIISKTLKGHSVMYEGVY
jgi:hypothetical protein